MAKEKEALEQTETPLAEPVTEKKSKIVKRNAAGAPIHFEIEADERCLLCGKNRKTRDSDYCSKCYDKLKKKKPPIAGYFVTLLLVAAGVAAFVLGFLNYAPAQYIVEGKSALAEKRLDDSGNAFGQALSLVSELNSEIGHNIVFVGKGIYVDFAKTTGNPLTEGNVAAQYLTESQIAADSELTYAVSMYKECNEAYNLVSGILTAVDAGEIEPGEAVKQLKELEAQNEQYKVWFMYFESEVAVTYGKKGREYQLESLMELEEQYPDYGWFYEYTLRTCLYALGKYDECLTYCNREIEQNRNAVDAYLAKLRIAMIHNDAEAATQVINDFKKYNNNDETVAVMNISYERVFGSLDKAIIMCDAALGNGSANVELNRQSAVNYLAKNNYTMAFEAAYNAYSTALSNYSQYGDSSELTDSLRDTVFVCTKMYQLYGDGTSQFDADAETIMQNAEGYDEQLSAVSLSILSGEVDPAEALTKGTGDLI